MTKSPITPLADRIVATRETAQTKTAAGLYLPQTDTKERSQIAQVVAVGTSVKEVKVGDKIIVREYSTADVKVDNVEYVIVKEEDVLAKVGQ
jgi:chaperonin GroES